MKTYEEAVISYYNPYRIKCLCKFMCPLSKRNCDRFTTNGDRPAHDASAPTPPNIPGNQTLTITPGFWGIRVRDQPTIQAGIDAARIAMLSGGTNVLKTSRSPEVNYTGLSFPHHR
jgi:hypothetical protein